MKSSQLIAISGQMGRVGAAKVATTIDNETAIDSAANISRMPRRSRETFIVAPSIQTRLFICNRANHECQQGVESRMAAFRRRHTNSCQTGIGPSRAAVQRPIVGGKRTPTRAHLELRMVNIRYTPQPPRSG